MSSEILGMLEVVMTRWTCALSIALFLVAAGCADRAPHDRASSPIVDHAPVAAARPAAPDNPELKELFDADQADRRDSKLPGLDINRRDAAREKRAREILDAGGVVTGRDYYHAGIVFQHAPTIEGIELAHELAVIGASLGDRGSRWLAAASWDRLLVRLDRGQRFGTQFGRKDASEDMHLMPIEPGVTDSMRAALNCPSLAKVIEQAGEPPPLSSRPVPTSR